MVPVLKNPTAFHRGAFLNQPVSPCKEKSESSLQCHSASYMAKAFRVASILFKVQSFPQHILLVGKGKMEVKPKQQPCKVLSSKPESQSAPVSPEYLSRYALVSRALAEAGADAAVSRCLQQYPALPRSLGGFAGHFHRGLADHKWAAKSGYPPVDQTVNTKGAQYFICSFVTLMSC